MGQVPAMICSGKNLQVISFWKCWLFNNYYLKRRKVLHNILMSTYRGTKINKADDLVANQIACQYSNFIYLFDLPSESKQLVGRSTGKPSSCVPINGYQIIFMSAMGRTHYVSNGESNPCFPLDLNWMVYTSNLQAIVETNSSANVIVPDLVAMNKTKSTKTR